MIITYPKRWPMKARVWMVQSIVEAKLRKIAPYFSFGCLLFVALAGGCYSYRVEAKTNQAAMCLAENLYHEGRGESTSNLYILGMLTLARVSDPHWPGTICGVVAQARQFSWVLDYKLATERSEQKKWEQAKYIARDLLANAWTKYVLPQGWGCARFYKRTDGKGVSRASLRFFDAKLFPVGSFGHHTAFQAKHGCSYPLPTN